MKKILNLLFALLLISGCSKSQQSNVSPVSTLTNTGLSKTGYLITFGFSQSNGTCRFTQSGNIAAKYTTTLSNCYTYYKSTNNSSDNGVWQQQKAGVNDQQGTAQTGYFGVSTFLAHRLDSMYNKSAYIINSSVGGTYIANDVNPSWNVSHSGQYYNTMINYHFRPALAKLSVVLTPVLVIIHGESDSDTQAHGQAYYQNMYDGIVKFRQDSGFPNMKVIITRLRSDYAGPPILGLSYVRQAQLDLATNLPNVVIYDTDTALSPLSSDGQHYNPIAGSYGGVMSAVNIGKGLADLISTP